MATKWVNSSEISLSKYCLELEALCSNINLMKAALPVDASCEDLEVDPHLPFLNDFVGQALANGAQPYIAPSQRAPSPEANRKGGQMRFEEYERQEAPVAPPLQYDLPGGAARRAPRGGRSAMGAVFLLFSLKGKNETRGPL